MTAKELAEKIVRDIDGFCYCPSHIGELSEKIESLLTAALEEAVLEGQRKECDWWKNAQPDEYRDRIVKEAKAAAYEDAAKIAEAKETTDHGRCDGICKCTCQEEIVAQIRLRAQEVSE